MKNILIISLICLVLVPSVFAMPFYQSTDTLELFEKNPNDWSIVEDGAYGLVKFTAISFFDKIVAQRIRVSVWGLEPKTKYTLIYYGDETHNDVYPYATCLKTRKTSTQGYFKSGSAKLNWVDMMNDEIAQKIWVVKSSDVDCKTNQMTAWNPTEYLFENNVI